LKFVPIQHHRRSIRLPGYDYAQSGAYFITIVTYQRVCLFGKIVSGEMQLSPLGQIANDHWCAIPEHFPHTELGAYVVMPNHLHGIIIIPSTHVMDGVGATHDVGTTHDVRATHWVAPTTTTSQNGPRRGSIGAIIGAYKMSVTRRIRVEQPEIAVWQRNFYEHIIRNDKDHERIHNYINANISNWPADDENRT
jgi:putative transposase